MPHPELNEIYLMLGEIRSDVKGLRAQAEDIDALDNRVTELEKWQARIVGITAATGAVVAAAFQLLN